MGGMTEPITIRTLFIGNSQMMQHDLPGMVKAAAASAPPSSPRIEPGYALRGGATLQTHWDMGDGPDTARGMIASGQWDCVVIQEIFFAQAPQFEDYAGRFDDAVRAAGARTILFATANITDQYAHGNPKAFQYPDCFLSLSRMHQEFGRKRNLPVADAAGAWMRYWGPQPTLEQRLDFYEQDKGHPGIKGSFIYAYVLYATITGCDPRNLPLPTGDVTCANGVVITPQELAAYRGAAWDAYRHEA